MHPRPKLLLIYPHDLAESGSGVNARVSQIVACLRTAFEVHQMGEINFESEWTNPNALNGPVDNVFLHDVDDRGTFLSHVKRWVKRIVGKKKRTKSVLDLSSQAPKSALKSFPDFVFPSTHSLLDRILSENEYAAILVSYVFWGRLVLHPKLKKVRKVLLLEDFQTSQLYHRHSSLYSLGGIFEEEVKRISLFDSVICISSQERWLFSQFCPDTKFHFIPHFLDQQTLPAPDTQNHLLFVGSDNPFNIEAINWFLDAVWPLLPPDTTLLVVGKVSRFVAPRTNVRLEAFVEHISEAYSNSMIPICPMLSGTGMKIKVIEALSFGRPMVCTLRGLDGFPDYHENGCLLSESATEFADHIIRLLNDRHFYDKVSNQAKTYFLRNFSKEKVAPTLTHIFLDEQ